MTKRLFLVSAAILMLAMAYHFGYRDAQAQSGSYFRVIGPGCFAVGNKAYVDSGSGWLEVEIANRLPIPLSTCVYFQAGGLAVTENGKGWRYEGGVWHSFGPLPGGTVNVQSETWSGVKEKYRQ